MTTIPTTTKKRQKKAPLPASVRETGHGTFSAPSAETGLDPIQSIPIWGVTPTPENNDIYGEIDTAAADMLALIADVKKHGIREPIVISTDCYIISGHRRYWAAKSAGLKTIPVRVEQISYRDDFEELFRRLVAYNSQRVKTAETMIREQIAATDPSAAYGQFQQRRAELGKVSAATIELGAKRERAEITKAKQPMLDAVLRVLKQEAAFLPITDRQIHYRLLNNPPLIHASKPASTYGNNPQSYKALTDLLTRGRLAGYIPMDSIADATRPVMICNTCQNVGEFTRAEMDRMFSGYWRDLQQAQPRHIELVAEKNTLADILRPVAADFCIPFTVGRGFCSVPPRAAIVDRFKRSGRASLVLLVVSDHDPEGESIPETLARSLRDDFGVTNIQPVKVALTAEQVKEYQLPPAIEAKASSSRSAGFVAKHGRHVHEVEALESGELQNIVRRAVESVLDVEAFNREVEVEKQDATRLEALRAIAIRTLRDADFDGGGSEA